MQGVAELPFLVKPNVAECLIETRDRAAVHLVVFAVAAVHPHNVRLVAVLTRVRRRAAERLRPVRREPLCVVRVKAVTECVADDLVGHHPLMPRVRETQHPLVPADGFVQRPHCPEGYALSAPRTQRNCSPAAGGDG